MYVRERFGHAISEFIIHELEPRFNLFSNRGLSGVMNEPYLVLNYKLAKLNAGCGYFWPIGQLSRKVRFL